MWICQSQSPKLPPPPPTTGNHQFVFYIRTSISVSVDTFLLDSTYEQYYMVFVFLWLHSVSQSLGPSLLLQMALFHSFLWLSIYILHLLYPSFCWWTFRLLHVLATVNSAAMNIGEYISFQIMVFSRYMPKSGIAGSCGSSIFSF